MDVTVPVVPKEVKDLGYVTGGVFLVIVLVALMVLLAGCVGPTKAEYRAFVDATRAFYDDVAPLCSEDLAGPAYRDVTGRQLKKNHEGELHDFGLALEQAEARAR